MPGAFSTATIIVALLLAGWALLCAVLNRAPDRGQLIGTVALSAVVLILLIGAASSWLGGDPPRETFTFIGYALTILLLPAGAWVVARMEPTRFGSVIVGVAALIVPVLVLRMGQVWGA